MDIEQLTHKEFTFLVWKLFRKGLKKAKEPDLREAVFDELIENALRGTVLGGRIRKARIGSERKNSGKSGGYRYLYYIQTQRTIHLMALLDKSEADNFDKAVLKELVGILKGMDFRGTKP